MARRDRSDSSFSVVASPANRSGRLDGYFHFVAGYLAPTIHALAPYDVRGEIGVQSTGPFDHFWSEVRSPRISVIAPEDFARARREAAATLEPRGFDSPTAHVRTAWMSVRRSVLEAFGVDVKDGKIVREGAPRILVIDRGSRDDTGGLGRGRGGQRRSVANMDDIIAAVQPLGKVTVQRLEGLTMREQMETFRGADIVLAQHGAALVNLLWARRGVRLIEIVTAEKENVLTGFYEGLGVAVTRIPQDGTHAAVPVDDIVKAIEDPADQVKPRNRRKASGGRTPVRWTARAWKRHEARNVDERDSARWAAQVARWPSAPADESTESPIFVLASAWRSGSTLAQRLLMSGGDALIWGEPFGQRDPVRQMTDMYIPFRDDFPSADHFLSRRQHAEDFDLATSWVANLYPGIPDLQRAHRAMLTTLLADPARAQGFARWGLKEVRVDGFQASYLATLYPDARLVFLIRNPYDAFRSYSSRGAWYDRFPDRPVFDAEAFGQHWRRLTQSFLDVAPSLGATVITFEQMVRDRAALDSLAAYTGIAIDPATLEVRKRGSAPEELDPIHPRDLRALELTVGDLAARWDYSPPAAD